MVWVAILPEIRELLQDNSFKQIKEILAEFASQEIARLIEEIPSTEKALIYRLLQKDTALEVFSYLDYGSQTDLLESLSGTEIQIILEGLMLHLCRI